MSLDVLAMAAVAAALTIVGVALLLRLRSPAITERRTYAYRMVGVMTLSAGVVLAFSAAALQRWGVEP